MSKELSEETKYEFNVYARQLSKDLSNLMELLRKQDEDNKAILYAGRHIQKIILPVEEYQKMCQRLESIDNANPDEALECLENLCDEFPILKKDYKIIKQALIKAQEQEKVLSIIKEYQVDIWLLKQCDYENYIRIRKEAMVSIGQIVNEDGIILEDEIPQEEFDLLKRYCYEQDNKKA